MSHNALDSGLLARLGVTKGMTGDPYPQVVGESAALLPARAEDGTAFRPAGAEGDNALLCPGEEGGNMSFRPAADGACRRQGGRTGIGVLQGSASAPDWVDIFDTGRRMRNIAQYRVSCPQCGFAKTLPKPAVSIIRWPAGPDREALADALRRASQDAIIHRIERLASVREYATEEMRARLLGEGFDGELVSGEIDRASSYGWLDDARFATIFVRSKRLMGWGDSRIAHELSRRGVSEQIVQDCLIGDEDPACVEADQIDRALAVLERKGASGANVCDKLYRRLAAKGFPPEVVSQAVCQYLDSHPEAHG